jgi:beta-phosphoglucomutase-like phosphatase (HAD superfamily)
MSDDYMNGLVGISVDDNVVQVKRDYNLTQPNRDLVDEKSSTYLELVKQLRPGPMDGFVEVTEEARRRGARLAVATSSPAVQLDVVVRSALAAMGLDGAPEDFFDAAVTGDDVARTKPAPDIYLETVRRLGVRPDRSIAFEDSVAGVEAAVAAGLVTVAVPTRYSAHLEFPGAIAVVGSLREALEADFFGVGREE